jgi:hypothetical protein
MDQRVMIASREFPKDSVAIRVPCNLKAIISHNYFRKSVIDEGGRNEIDDFQGSGEMFLTNYHFIFYTNKIYRFINPKTRIPALFEKPYISFHRSCLALVDFDRNIIRIDEVIHNIHGSKNFFGKFVFEINQDFDRFVYALGLVYNPKNRFVEYYVIPKFQSFYTTRYPQEWEDPHACPWCGFQVQFIERDLRYYCFRCNKFL